MALFYKGQAVLFGGFAHPGALFLKDAGQHNVAAVADQVGHAAVNQAVLAVLLGMEPGVARRFRSRNASLAQISMYLEGDRWTGVVDCWNFAAYLEDTK